MTVVAGALMADGVALAADCRLTVCTPSGREFVVDDAQKIVKLGDRTAIGFSGDLHTVSLMFGQIRGPQLKDRRLDGTSVRRWLPRFMRAAYAALRRTYPKEVAECSFLVASTVPNRPQLVSVRDVLRLLSVTSRLGHNNYLSMRIMNEINNPTGIVEVPGSSFGLLYALKSPDFVPRDVGTLSYTAIGSGSEEMCGSLRTYAPLMFCDDPSLAVGWFMEAVAAAFASTEVGSVGGLFVVTAMTNGKVRAMLASDTRPNEGAAVAIKGGRFVQIDRRTGKRIALRYPGEIDRAPPPGPNAFTPYRAFWTPPPPLQGLRLPEFISSELREELLRRRKDQARGT